jgi:hypothetical protein
MVVIRILRVRPCEWLLRRFMRRVGDNLSLGHTMPGYSVWAWVRVILIVDSDTIVPEVRYRTALSSSTGQLFIFILHDYFRDAVRELAECPEVALIQYDSSECVLPQRHPRRSAYCFVIDVMQVVHHISRMASRTLPAVFTSVLPWHA